MMFRTRSPAFVDVIVNHPDVRPFVEKGDHRIYSNDIVENFSNVVHACEHGVAIYIDEGDGVYKGHIALLKGGRGAAGLRFGRWSLDELSRQLSVRKVRAAVPLQLQGARLFCRLLGFRSTGRDAEQEFFEFRRTVWAD